MNRLVKVRDIEFQPLELFLQEKSNDHPFRQFRLNYNHQAIREAVQGITEDHFTKLYEHIHLNAKPLAKEISKIARQHFVKSGKQSKPRSSTYTDTPSLFHKRPPQILPPLNHERKVNRSFTAKQDSIIIDESTKLINMSMVHNTSLHELDEFSPQSKHHKARSTSSVRGSELHAHMKTKITIHESNLKQSSITELSSIDDLDTRKNKSNVTTDSIVTSKGNSPRHDKSKVPAFISNVLMNPMFREKTRVRIIQAKLEKLLDLNNPNFLKLIKLISGEDKAVSIKFVKLTREQLRNHLLKKYPMEISERFLQVMDFPLTFDVKTYWEIFKTLLSDALDMPYFLCFKLFDFNDDDLLNHRDIFTLLKYVEQYPFLKNDFYRFLYKPEKTAVHKLVQFTTKNLFRNSNTTARTSQEESSALQAKRGFAVNKQTLAAKVTLLKNLESIVSKQNEKRIINLNQLRMAYHSDLPTFLNFKRSKFKTGSLIEIMTSHSSPNAGRKASVLETASKLSGTLQAINSPVRHSIRKSHDMSTRRDHFEAISEWGETGLDIIAFSELFKDEMPFLLYDLFFHCLLVNFEDKGYTFNADDVFDLYNVRAVTSNNLTNSTLHNLQNTKTIKTSNSMAVPESKLNTNTKTTQFNEDRE